MKVPEHIKRFAEEHGFDYVKQVKRNSKGTIYCVNKMIYLQSGFPTGLPNYITDYNGTLTLVFDEDLHITASL